MHQSKGHDETVSGRMTNTRAWTGLMSFIVNRNLRVPFFFAGFLPVSVVQFPGELVELVDDGHLGVEYLVEAVSHEVGILVGSVTTVDEILESVDDQVVHGDALVLGDVLDPSFHTAGDGDVEFLFGSC